MANDHRIAMHFQYDVANALLGSGSEAGAEVMGKKFGAMKHAVECCRLDLLVEGQHCRIQTLALVACKNVEVEGGQGAGLLFVFATCSGRCAQQRVRSALAICG